MPALRDRYIAADPDTLAPDGSQIRLLVSTPRCSMVHCTLPAGAVSLAVRHRTVEEVWYVLEGSGELWRELGTETSVLPLHPGLSVSIPLGTCFQFRTIGAAHLRILIVTLPPWPGAEEAERVADHWPTGQPR